MNLSPPPASITLERSADRLKIVLEPDGWREAWPLLVVGLAGIVAIGPVAVWLVGRFPSPGAMALVAVAGTALFALCVALLMAAVRGAVGETSIVVTEALLSIEFTGPFHQTRKAGAEERLPVSIPIPWGSGFSARGKSGCFMIARATS